MNRIRARMTLMAFLSLLIAAATACSPSPDAPLRVNGKGYDRDYLKAMLQLQGLESAATERRRAALEAMLTEELFAQAAEAGEAVGDLSARVRVEQLLRRHRAQAYRDRILAASNAEEQARSLYAERRERYRRFQRRLGLVVAHVAERAGQPVDEAGARARIDAAHMALLAGRPLAEVARSFSDDPLSRTRGGEMGEVLIDALDPALRESARSLKTGAFTAPIRTTSGFAILFALEETGETLVPYEAVRSELLAEVHDEILRREKERLMKLGTVHLDTDAGGL